MKLRSKLGMAILISKNKDLCSMNLNILSRNSVTECNVLLSLELRSGWLFFFCDLSALTHISDSGFLLLNPIRIHTTDFKPKLIKIHEEGHFLLIIRKHAQDDISNSICAINTSPTPMFITEILLWLK